MTATKFCQVEGFSLKSFYYWRRRLMTASGEDATKNVATDLASNARPVSEAFAPVRLVGGASVAAWLPGGTRLEIPLADPAAARVALEAILLADGRRADAEAAVDNRPVGKRRQGGSAC
jgi:hypothetical protein